MKGYKFLHIDDVEFNTREAFRYFDNNGELVRITFEEFYCDIERAIAWLHEKLYDLTGKHIGIIAHNSYDYIVHFYAIIGSGAIVVLLNPDKTWEETQYEIDWADVSFLITDDATDRYLSAFTEKYGDIISHVEDYRKVTARKKWVEPEHSALSAMVFTSGTTEKSKAVVLSYGNLFSIPSSTPTFFDMVCESDESSTVRYFSCLPLYHMFAIGTVLSCISYGYVSLLNNDRLFFLRDMVKLGGNCAGMVPVQIELMAKQIDRIAANGKIKHILYGGASCPPDSIQKLNKHGVITRSGYGLTECAIGTRNDSQDFTKRESVGKAYGDTQIKISDGEILLKGSTLFQGYYKDPESTNRVLIDGWLHTGDLGYVDEDGYLYITGRKKNLIILSSGENINPEEIENLLYRNEDIIETIVTMKDGKICAQVYCSETAHEEVQNYIRNLNRILPKYKYISIIEFRTTPFERTSTGKIKQC